MADTKIKFETTVIGALAVAEAELNREGLDAGNVRNALKELRALLKPVSSRHFAGLRKQHKHIVGQLFPMLQRTAVRWYKQMKRRLSARCGVRNPWKAIMEENLTKELFDVLKNIISRTNYGLSVTQTRKTCFLAFSKEIRVRRLFCDLMDSEITSEEFLKRKIKGLRRIEAIINDEKEFNIRYNYEKEVITFEFCFGSWNEHGWPQHV